MKTKQIEAMAKDVDEINVVWGRTICEPIDCEKCPIKSTCMSLTTAISDASDILKNELKRRKGI